MDQNPNSTKVGKKIIEKNRRSQMKALYSQLTSLVPHQSPGEMISVADQLEGATNHIKKMQVSLEKMKRKKNCLVGSGVSANSSSTSSNIINGGAKLITNFDVRLIGSDLEVVMVTGLNCHQFMFGETVRMLHEEGAEVVSANYSVQENNVFHTIHSKIEESAHDNAVARISERLRKFA